MGLFGIELEQRHVAFGRGGPVQHAGHQPADHRDPQPAPLEASFQPAEVRRHRGAGLGLTLARGLIEKLGGSLSLQSEIGQGSRFSFALPVTIC